VAGVDRDRDGGRGNGVHRAVIGPVGEAVRAGIADGWGVGERTVGKGRERTVSRVSDETDREVVAVGVGVVGEQAGRRDSQAAILIYRIAVGIGHRRVVDRRGDGDRYGRVVRSG